MKNPVVKIGKFCEHCGKSFFVHPYRSRTARFCSGSCRAKHAIGKNAYNWRGKIEKTCDNCGKTYEVYPCLDKVTRFCSHSCKSQFTLKDGKAPWYRGDIQEYPDTFNDEFKRIIRERDGYTCQICGEFGNEVHHINYVKKDTTLDNCITLCCSCHLKTRTNREYWQTRLSALVFHP